MKKNLSDIIFRRGREFLNVEYPIICGAMSWVSDPRLVSAVSNSGGLGILAGGNMEPSLLSAQVKKTAELTGRPFGVNLITISPFYGGQLNAVLSERPSFVVFAGGIPRNSDIQAAKDAGSKTFCFAANLIMARRMIEYGADALIIEGMEGGGHLGHLALSVLLQEVLFNIGNVPVFAGGGIATGRMCAHLLLMGAAGVQLGTRFAVSEESPAHPDFKKKYITAKSRDAVASAQFDSRLPVSPVRALKNKGTDEFSRLQLELIKKLDDNQIGREEAALELEKFWMGGLQSAVQNGETKRGSLMAGQSVGLVDKIQPVKEIINELVKDIEKELERVYNILNPE